jgi:hypothetical protein
MRSTRLYVVITALFVALCASAAMSVEPHSNYSNGRCGGSPAHWSPKGSEFGELLLNDKLYVAPGGLTWNGIPIMRDGLERRLSRARRMPPNVGLQVVFSGGTDCRLVQSIRKQMDAALRCGRDHKCIEYSEREARRNFPPPRSR